MNLLTLVYDDFDYQKVNEDFLKILNYLVQNKSIDDFRGVVRQDNSNEFELEFDDSDIIGDIKKITFNARFVYLTKN